MLWQSKIRIWTPLKLEARKKVLESMEEWRRHEKLWSKKRRRK